MHFERNMPKWLAFRGCSCVSLNLSWSPKAAATLLLNMRASHGVTVWYDLVMQLEWAKGRSYSLAVGDITHVNFYLHTSSSY